VSGFEYRTASFLPPDLDVPATLSATEWLGLMLWYAAVASRQCVCGAPSTATNAAIPHKGGLSWPRSYGPRRVDH
jgi:hypothetical protein